MIRLDEFLGEGWLYNTGGHAVRIREFQAYNGAKYKIKICTEKLKTAWYYYVIEADCGMTLKSEKLYQEDRDARLAAYNTLKKLEEDDIIISNRNKATDYLYTIRLLKSKHGEGLDDKGQAEFKIIQLCRTLKIDFERNKFKADFEVLVERVADKPGSIQNMIVLLLGSLMTGKEKEKKLPDFQILRN